MSRLCRLKSYKNIGDDGKWAYSEITQLGKQLAESQAREAKLREAIEFTRQYVGEDRLPPLPGWSWFDALALPHDDTALKEYHDSIVEKCANLCDAQANEPECPERAKYCADAIRSRKGAA